MKGLPLPLTTLGLILLLGGLAAAIALFVVLPIILEVRDRRAFRKAVRERRRQASAAQPRSTALGPIIHARGNGPCGKPSGIYCSRCGLELVELIEPNGRYDDETGKPGEKLVRRCPRHPTNSFMAAIVGNHDCFSGPVDGSFPCCWIEEWR